MATQEITATYFVDKANALLEYGKAGINSDYSPNNIKRIFFSKDGIIVSYYVERSAKASKWDFDFAVRSCSDLKSPLSLLTSDRICKNIQEIYFLMDSYDMVSLKLFDFQHMVSLQTKDGNFRFPRLQGVFYIKDLTFNECITRLQAVSTQEIKNRAKCSMVDWECGFKPFADSGRLGTLNLPYNKDWRYASGLTGGSISTYPGLEGEGRPLRKYMDELKRALKAEEVKANAEKLKQDINKANINELLDFASYFRPSTMKTLFSSYLAGIQSQILNGKPLSAETLHELFDKVDAQKIHEVEALLAKSFAAYVHACADACENRFLDRAFLEYQASDPFARTCKVLKKVHDELVGGDE